MKSLPKFNIDIWRQKLVSLHMMRHRRVLTFGQQGRQRYIQVPQQNLLSLARHRDPYIYVQILMIFVQFELCFLVELYDRFKMYAFRPIHLAYFYMFSLSWAARFEYLFLFVDYRFEFLLTFGRVGSYDGYVMFDSFVDDICLTRRCASTGRGWSTSSRTIGRLVFNWTAAFSKTEIGWRGFAVFGLSGLSFVFGRWFHWWFGSVYCFRRWVRIRGLVTKYYDKIQSGNTGEMDFRE